MAAVTALAIGAAATVAGTVISAHGANKERKRNEELSRTSTAEMNRLKGIYNNLDTSNPFLNMTNNMSSLSNQYAGLENTMEDLTVNQKQAQFQADQFQRSQANILGSLREASGGSGVAALAQSLSQQGEIAAQKSSASIGMQETRNKMASAQQANQLQMMEAQGADRIQMAQAQEATRLEGMERQGEVMSRNWKRDAIATQLGMSQQETAAYNNAAGQANQQMWNSIGSGVQNLGSMVAGFGGGGSGGGGGGTTNNYYGPQG
tara:strand:- start:16047 stop:16835 length:789 start_codon:yes stop_codon:yes gene_type:complete